MNSQEITALINALMDKLEGEWVLVGGSLLHYLGLTDRQTLDIDLVPKSKVDNTMTLAAMEIAVSHHQPPETINFSAEYFLKKQKSWEKQLVVLKKTKKGAFYRPNKKLFRKLKEARGSETDLLDIEVYEAGVKD